MSHIVCDCSWAVRSLKENNHSFPKSISPCDRTRAKPDDFYQNIWNLSWLYWFPLIVFYVVLYDDVCLIVCYLHHISQCSPASCCVSRCRDTLALCAPRCSCPGLCSETLCTHSGFHNSGHERAIPGNMKEEGEGLREKKSNACSNVTKQIILVLSSWLQILINLRTVGIIIQSIS